MAETIAILALAWLITYALHSTLLLGGAWLWSRRDASHARRETIWRIALLGGLLTASLQVASGWKPWGGSWALASRGHDVARTALDTDFDLFVPAMRDAHEFLVLDGASLGGTQLDASQLDGAGAGQVPARLASARWTTAPRQTERVQIVMDVRAKDAPSAAPRAGPRELLCDGTWTTASGLASRSDSGGGSQPEPFEPLEIGTWLGRLRSVDAALANAEKRSWLPPMAALWFLGALVALVPVFRARRRLDDRLVSRTELRAGRMPGLLAALLRRAGVRRRVRLSCSPSLNTPISFGILRPEICVPLRAATDLARAEQETLLAHELAHVVRRDALWLHVYRWIECVLFFQPLNRLARRRLHESTECRCDDWAVRHTGSPLSLARCLAQVASWVVRPEVLPAPAMSARGSALSMRVERLLGPCDERAAGRSYGLALGSIGLLAAVTAGAPCVAPFGDAEDESGTPTRLGLVLELASEQLESVHALDARGIDSAVEVDEATDDGAQAGASTAHALATASAPRAQPVRVARVLHDSPLTDGRYALVHGSSSPESAPASAVNTFSVRGASLGSGVGARAGTPGTSDEVRVHAIRFTGELERAAPGAGPLGLGSRSAHGEPSSLGGALALLDAEIGQLELELALLRSEADTLEVQERLAATLERLERGLESLRQRREQLETPRALAP